MGLLLKVFFILKYIKIIFFIFKQFFLTLIYNKKKAFETQMTSHSLQQGCFIELAEILQASRFLLYRKVIHVRVRAFLKLWRNFSMNFLVTATSFTSPINIQSLASNASRHLHSWSKFILVCSHHCPKPQIINPSWYIRWKAISSLRPIIKNLRTK